MEHALWKLGQRQGRDLAGTMPVLCFLASGPEHGTVWKKAMGQRLMKSRKKFPGGGWVQRGQGMGRP